MLLLLILEAMFMAVMYFYYMTEDSVKEAWYLQNNTESVNVSIIITIVITLPISKGIAIGYCVHRFWEFWSQISQIWNSKFSLSLYWIQISLRFRHIWPGGNEYVWDGKGMGFASDQDLFFFSDKIVGLMFVCFVSGQLSPKHLCPGQNCPKFKSVKDIWFADKIVQKLPS